MSGEVEAAGDALTGAIVAGTVEGGPSAAGHGGHGHCLNCGATLTGAYCAACGQPAHLHRSLSGLLHDLLHGVFHFEGRIWHTLPELVLHPGRLTRRYIAGERARFVSPMALFLFLVFLTFAVISLTGWVLSDGHGGKGGTVVNIENGRATVVVTSPAEMASAVQAGIARSEARQAELQARRDAPGLSDAQRAELDEQLAEVRQEHAALAELLGGTPGHLTGRLGQVLKRVADNPQLVAYKLKTNGYKYSWALIPMSLPFMWLLFCTRRDVAMYDHAIFVTYSISFVLLLFIAVSVAAKLGVPDEVWGLAFVAVPPMHMYAQLRGAYGLSRGAALWRLALLLVFIVIVLSVFSSVLLTLGVLD